MASVVLGIDHLTALDLEPRAFIRAAAGAGFGTVSLRTIHIAGGEPPWAGQPLDAPRFAQEAAARGVRVHAIEAVAITPRMVQDLDRLRLRLAQGAELGAEMLYSFADDPEPARCAESFGLLARAAHEFGLRTLLEPMPYRAVATLGRASEIVASSGVHGCGVVVDALHATRSGTGPAGLAALPQRMLAVLQLCDAPTAAPAGPAPSGLDPRLHEARFDRRLPGDGELPLGEFIRSMPENAVITVEAPLSHGDADPTTRLRRARAALTSVLPESWRSGVES